MTRSNLLSFVCGALAVFGVMTIAGPSHAQSPNHVYELRTYTAPPGKLDALIARFRDHTEAIFKRHNLKAVGYGVPEDNKNNQLIYILDHKSKADADKNWDELERRCAVHVNVDSTGGIGATVLRNAAAAPELVGLAGDAIGEQAGSEYDGRRMSRSSDQSFWGIGIPAMFGALSEQPPAPVRMRNALGWWWHTPHDLLDKIDEKNLVRDTRVFVHTLWRLLTDPVLPLDFAAHARALLDELGKLRTSLGDRFSADSLIAGAERLRERAAAGGHSDAALMRASRALAPVYYTSGDRFAGRVPL